MWRFVPPWENEGKKGSGKSKSKAFPPPNFSAKQPAKRFKGADDELTLIRNGTLAALNLGIDNARQTRNLKGVCIPTCLVPETKCLKDALSVEPNLQNPMVEIVTRWKKLGKGLSEETRVSKPVRDKLKAAFEKPEPDEQLFGPITCCSVFPTFENKDQIKVELNVQTELRSVLVAIFGALVELGGVMKYCAPPRRFPERQAQDFLYALLRK